MALATCENLATLGERISHMLLDLVHGRHVDQRSLVGRTFEAIADFELADRGGQPPGELRVHALLNQEAIRAHAGLSGISILAGQRTLNCGL